MRGEKRERSSGNCFGTAAGNLSKVLLLSEKLGDAEELVIIHQ